MKHGERAPYLLVALEKIMKRMLLHKRLLYDNVHIFGPLANMGASGRWCVICKLTYHNLLIIYYKFHRNTCLIKDVWGNFLMLRTCIDTKQ